MNIKLLQRIKRRILARPRQFIMSHYYSTLHSGGLQASHCGTAACIAGWAIALQPKVKNPKRAYKIMDNWATKGPMERTIEAQKLKLPATVWAEDMAADLLDLDEGKAEKLFHLRRWPIKFQDEWEKVAQYPAKKAAESRAKTAAKRIDYFIKNNR